MDWQATAGGQALIAWFAELKAPDEAGIAAVERWLTRLASPEQALAALAAFPPGARALATIFANSDAWTNVVIQNPEFGVILTEPHTLAARVEAGKIEEEALRLARLSVSYSHILDRLRFLRQRETLRILANELSGFWSPPESWRALSELAEGLLRAAAQLVEGKPDAPVSIVAFGKLGAHELNLSSDIDLTYLLDDDADEAQEVQSAKWSAALGRALSDRMGRGAVYRVDTRLRPFGKSGPLVCRWRAAERYYRDYAEPWEQMALIRSRVIVGPGADRWEQVRQNTAFRGVRGEWVLDELRQMRATLDNFKGDNDLKRSPGGIRDIEFAVQMRQMLFGGMAPEVQVGNTLEAIEALAHHNLVGGEDAYLARESYILLRRWEHALQAVADSQTHELPRNEAAWARFAAASGAASVEALKTEIGTRRQAVRHLYESLMRAGSLGAPSSARQAVADRLADLKPLAERWFEPLANADELYQSLAENEGSLHRAKLVLERAPTLATELASQPALTELILSGEIEEEKVAAPKVWSPDRLRRAWLAAAVRWCLNASDFRSEWSQTLDSALAELTEPLGLIALGSWAIHAPGLRSDADAILWSISGGEEEAAQEALQRAQRWRGEGSPVTLDIRLRPEGRQGPLAVTASALEHYAQARMEPWERMALARFRPVARADDAVQPICEAIFASPPDRESLRLMKKRLETERVSGAHRLRHLKHAPGGLEDIEWLAYLGWFEVPSAHTPGQTIPALLHKLALHGFLNLAEAEQLAEAYDAFHHARLAIALQGFPADVLPENPDKLATLANTEGATSGNEWLKQIEDRRQAVRAIFEQVTGWERR